MSYLALARKWRPKTFADVAGQGHVVRALENALSSGRLHHAFLFTGTRGIGKTTIARIFVKALNCERGVSATPCGECGSCVAIDAGRFVDFLEVDAADMTVVHIFQTDVPAVDKGSIWLPMDKLEKMTGLVGHASEFILSEGFDPSDTGGWTYKSQAMLLQDITDIIAMKKTSSSVLYLMLVAIALIAIFDTQVLSVFRRQREIGTYVALGMTRTQVVGLFTVEGSMYSLLAMAVGCIVGIPLFVYLATTGIAFPTTTMAQDMGVAISDRIFPVFGVQLVLGTVLLVVIAATIVSFLPARKIARMNAVEALKGKLQ